MKERLKEVTNSSGLKIRGKYFLPDGIGPFPTVVLFHGLTGTYRETRNIRLLRALTSEGILGIGFDFTCEANSTSEGKFFDQTLDSRLLDANTVLDKIEHCAEVDKGRVGVCGHSFGGLVAALISYQRKEIKALALISAGWNVRGELPYKLGILPKQWKKQGYAEFPKNWLVPGKKLGWGFYESFKDYDPQKTAAGIDCPTIILHGENDTVVFPDKAKLYFDNLKSEKKLVYIKDGDHIFSDKKAQEELIREVVRWFKEKLRVN